MITGSHLATKYNGIKMAYGALALADQQILDLLKMIQQDAFAVGQGKVDRDFNMLHQHMEHIKGMVKIERPLKVVLDAGNGMSGVPVPPVLTDLGIEVTCLYCESDGTYPNHLPNPEDEETTKDLEPKSSKSARISVLALTVTRIAAASSTIRGITSRRIGCWRCWRAICSHATKARRLFST